MNKQAVIESAKELGRVMVISVLPILMSSINTQTGEININWQIVLAALIVAFLKAIDKYIHKEPEIKAQGLLPF